VLQIGSNDLTDNGCSVEQFVVNYSQYIDYLHRRYRVHRVVVMEILRRTESSSYSMNMSVDDYNEKVDKTNAELKLMCTRSSNAVFWQHNKHVRLPGVICSDGVHLRTRDMKNYWRSVRGAVMRAALGH